MFVMYRMRAFVLRFLFIMNEYKNKLMVNKALSEWAWPFLIVDS